MAGALAGIRIIEIAGIGPGPFAAMMLADHGADVIRVERPGPAGMFDPTKDALNRSRRSIGVDLKKEAGADLVRRLAAGADGLIEGFRPGVMERLGLGPDRLLADNPRLVYGRMTGWGQEGPLASAAGHDINYIALAGNLHGYGRAESNPTPAINAVGDFGGGGMLLAFGMLAGLLHAQRGGHGQVIDAAMIDGAALLHTMTWSFRAMGLWQDRRGANYLDGAAHFYDTYETADGRFVSIGAIEPQFYERLWRALDLEGDPDFADQFDRSRWPEMKARLAAIFRTRTRDQWCELLEPLDLCFAPVLSMEEAPGHPHNRARAAFVESGGVTQPAPAPRFSATPAARPSPPNTPGAHTREILAELGLAPEEVHRLDEDRAIF